MTVEFASFDVANYLDNEKVIEEYLLAAAEDPDPEILLTAKSDVVRARAVNAIRKAKREYKNLAPTARPHPSVFIVSAILILTIIIQVILVKSWT